MRPIHLTSINQKKRAYLPYSCLYIDQITLFSSEKSPLIQTIQTGKICEETVFIKNSARPKGVFIDITGSPIKGADDLILGGIVVFKNITEGIKSEILIRQSEERLKAQFKGFPIPTYVWQNVG